MLDTPKEANDQCPGRGNVSSMRPVTTAASARIMSQSRRLHSTMRVGSFGVTIGSGSDGTMVIVVPRSCRRRSQWRRTAVLASLPGSGLERASKHARLASAGLSRLEADRWAEAAPHGMKEITLYERSSRSSRRCRSLASDAGPCTAHCHQASSQQDRLADSCQLAILSAKYWARLRRGCGVPTASGDRRILQGDGMTIVLRASSADSSCVSARSE